VYICMYAHMYVVYARIFICVYTYVYTHECGAKRVCVPSDCVGVSVFGTCCNKDACAYI